MNILFLSIVPKGEFYSSLADEFYRNGHTVTFVSPSEGKTRFEDFKNHKILYFHSGKMLNVSIPRKGWNNIRFPSLCLKAVKHYINPNDYHCILMSTPPLGYLSSIQYMKRINPTIKFYLILRDIHPEGSRHLLKKVPGAFTYFKMQAQALYNLADVVGCMSPYNINLIQKNYKHKNPDKVQLLPNWGRLEENTVPSEIIIQKYNLVNKFIVFYGGNMGKPQNLLLFLKLAKEKQYLNNVLFFFIGSGTEREKLREIVRNEGICNVRIEDEVSHEEYLQLLCCANLGIITLSPIMFFANCPSKAISYWQNKIPILASLDHVTDFGTYYIDRSKSGLWSYADDFDTLSANFDKLYQNDVLRKEMGGNGYKFFIENFTVDRIYNTIMNSLGF